VTPGEIRTANMTYDTLRIAQKIISQQETVMKDQKAVIAKSDSIISKQEELHVIDLKKINNLNGQTTLLTTANNLLLDKNSLLIADKKKLKKKLGWLTGLSTTVIGGLVYLLVK
jgi:hypothetical protein